MSCTNTNWRVILWLILLPLITGCGGVRVIGLRPEYPEVRSEGFPDKKLAFVEVDSLQPTFRWQLFPRPQDLEPDKEGLLTRIGNVTYELKILQGQIDYPTKEIYSRVGLPGPYHRIEHPLEPSTKYFWNVRARFEIDGRTRITEWGASWYDGRRGGSCGSEFPPYIWLVRNLALPSPFSHCFKTPSK